MTTHLPSLGTKLPSWLLPIDATAVVAGAVATRDFYPIHIDHAAAIAAGLPDIILNVCTLEAYLARYVTDWAGPEVRLTGMAFRLRQPTVPGDVLTFTGTVVDEIHDLGWVIAVSAGHDRGVAIEGSVTFR